MNTALLGRMLVACAFLLCAVETRAQSGTDVEKRVRTLLEAMGGKEAWARTTSMRIDARHYEADMASPYDNRIVLSFEKPLIRIEARSDLIRRTRAIAGNAGWHVSEKNPVREMTAEQVEGDIKWWEAHIYRTVHRLAFEDTSLKTELTPDGRLLIRHRDGRPLLWIRQNLAGDPIQFGVGEAATGTIFGPLLQREGIRIPQFSVSPDGKWRAVISDIEANPDLSKVDFARP